MVCDKRYTILYLNAKAAEVYSVEGGKGLVGKNMMSCHPPEAQAKLRKVMTSGRPNAYTIGMKGAERFVYQCHWKKGRRVGGLVQFTFELPNEVPKVVKS
jgi:hypothetical protein